MARAKAAENPTPAAAYLRTSSAANVGGDSDARQREAIGRFAQAHGHELVDEFHDAAVSGADPRNYERAVANSRYKLIRRADGSRAFYDLSSDPYETTNLLSRTLTKTQRSNLDTLTRRMAELLATGAGSCQPVAAPGAAAAAPR